MNPHTQVLGTAVVITGPALADAYYLITAGMQYAHRSGYSTTRFKPLQEALGAAVAQSRTRHNDVAPPPIDTDCTPELIDVTEAAHMLALSKRQVQRIARSLDGRIIGGRWLFDRNAVSDYANQRTTP
ncbi:helix-turn-helix domain-containing protein [Rhodococcus aetherivorans]|nr:helix-turn-helix domain-containing protein [Rhodococcus aetherivorans]MDV6292244.1 helix-turn-helix domain-containing protein [Rhodococcus aetherivorans]